MSEDDNSNSNSMTIKSVFDSKKKRSEVWKYFGGLYNDEVLVDEYYHCILCFNDKKLMK